MFLLAIHWTACGSKKSEAKDVVILFTGDVHCGIDKGFGYAGLWQLREDLEAEGCATLLVDCGDSIQGEPVGMLSKGGAVVALMDAMRYDAAVPGNHEFDYGTGRFLELAKQASFPYICCNFEKEGRPVFPPYVIKEAGGIQVAFVGVTTPTTFTSSSPANFQDEEGTYVYSFMQDMTGDPLYQAVQDAVDAARAAGADYVYALAHLGNNAQCSPWTCMDVISHTEGIDVFLDGHSHDTERLVIQNRAGKDVVRVAAGSKLDCIGYSRIQAKRGKGTSSIDTGIWRWPDRQGEAAFSGIQNEMEHRVRAVKEELDDRLETVLADLSAGIDGANSRRRETEIGDFCTDAFRQETGADIAIMNGGGIRASLPAGRVTYGDVLTVFPFGNSLAVVRATGRQILDALEWSSRMLPSANGGFLQVSGLRYEVDTSVPSGCIADERGMCIGIEGRRRVRNVTVDGKPIEEDRLYTVAGPDYVLVRQGDGMTAFDGAVLLSTGEGLDACVADALARGAAAAYGGPLGQGRIVLAGS